MQQILKNLNIEKLNSMQEEYSNAQSKFTVLLANTGSGKTLAFLFKYLKNLESSGTNDQLLIISPTRELAQQIHKVVKQLRIDLSSIVCYGGHSFKNEKLQFLSRPKIVIATPGRILDHLQRQTEGLSEFSHVIIDEYDKSLDLGFTNELSQIFEFFKPLDSLQLISATVIDEIPIFLSAYKFITVDRILEVKPDLTFYKIEAEENDKLKALVLILQEIQLEPTLVFCTHRDACERLASHLKEYGKEVEVFHGGLEQQDRQLSLFKFKSKSVDCLVCSDLASRGLDIDEIKHIIHYQYPQTLEDFTHRNGRTARMSQQGNVFLLHAEKEPIPSYAGDIKFNEFKLNSEFIDFENTQYITLFANIGRKHKVRKSDFVGFFTKELDITFANLGLIEVFDNFTYFSINSSEEIKFKKESFKLKKNNFKVKRARNLTRNS